MALLGLSFLGIFSGGEMVGAIMVLVNPLKDPKIRSAPEILAMADEVCAQPIYHDKYMLISKRIIANANNLHEIAYEPKEKLALIKRYCRYVRFGHTDAGMVYAKQMCEAWQRERSEETPEEILRKTYYLGQADADNGKRDGKRQKDKFDLRGHWGL